MTANPDALRRAADEMDELIARQASDLLPCPFCGSTNIGEPIRRRPLQVACIDCGGEGPEALTVDDARARWNARAVSADSDTLRARVARLERVLAVERGDEAAAPSGWYRECQGTEWNHGDAHVWRLTSGRWRWVRPGGFNDADTALEAMEAADAAMEVTP